MSTLTQLRTLPDRGLSLRSWILSLLSVTVFISLVAWSAVRHFSQPPINTDQPNRLERCRAEVQRSLAPQTVSLELLGEIHGLCYARVDEEDVLQEFGVRRAAYVNQQYQVPIMLWMVVAITISGVVLAGLQLMAGYRLAATGLGGLEPKGEFEISPKKIAVNSTVTGVLILAISLAFFYFFVKYVYLIRELPIPAATSEAGTPNLHEGWGKQNPQFPVGILNQLPKPQTNAPSTGTNSSGPAQQH
jgi:hypothetical protein